MFDLIIRNGLIVDGTGAPAFTGDVAVDSGRIVEIGRVSDSAHDQIDAEGRLVTPGFVDPHDHYDGQVIWDDTLAPSFGHGVTTVVMGNYGVGFAPVRPGSTNQSMLIDLMEGVEDISGSVLRAGMDWTWESFPEYLDALTLPAPYLVNDLPGNGSRLMQDATGYAATIVAGTVTRRDDQDTGVRPGRLLRGSR